MSIKDKIEFTPIEVILDDLRLGKMVIIVDDEDRENEGDLIIAADKVTPEDINFMAKNGRGLICLTLTQSRCNMLRLPLMSTQNNGLEATNFTVSIEASEGVTTGISAQDRARTVKVATAPNAKPEDLVQPGHIFPLMAKPGGVLTRAGHTEAGCDLARLAGLTPASVIVEILNEDGSMARRSDLVEFGKKHGINIGTIADLIRYRISNEQSIEKIHEEKINTEYGKFNLITFQDHINKEIHFALTKGTIHESSIPLVRVHVSNTIRDSIGIDNDNLGWPLKSAMKQIAQSDTAVLVVLCYQELPKDLINAVKNLSKSKENKVSNNNTSILRNYGTGSQILREIGIKKMRVVSEPKQMQAISGFDLEILEYIDKEGI
ncbi:MAG: bifunctional 3,4-dihydroxy-2-butanone-4-phosphate synthase/GTP cyclohydrolase II [Gammaproteobacteria bacterium]|jgi:3,4-dihydroxy 2-butanone 4-phosphate synthase/GTP cyclohydrolase II|nr:bifunctional 3,4-dihydroxy-2-butanone-4-phosphate synthase/GTP cyclohydrolase II [Gammaproteobacteria bacterium]